MIQRNLDIGRWHVEFYFCPDGYDFYALYERLYDLGADLNVLRSASELMEREEMNTGYTFSNPYDHVALVAVGPTTSGGEFIDTFVHELYHLAVGIAQDLGVDLTSEAPAYMIGDMTRDLASTICELGCSRCHKSGDQFPAT
jgi:hypothetical protein